MTRRRPGRQHDRGERNALPSVEADLACPEIDCFHRSPAEQLNSVRLVEVAVVHPRRLGNGLATEHGFGQRGPFVGRNGLVADEHDAAVVAAGAGAFGGLGPGETGPDDDERAIRCHDAG